MEALLDWGRTRGVRAWWGAGDFVGYGPEPARCLEAIRGLPGCLVQGNHDAAVGGLLDLSEFTPPAAAGVRWTREQLGEADRASLARLPLTAVREGCLVAHGTPWEPERWHYLEESEAAARSFDALPGRIAFVGHTHRPGLWSRGPDGRVERADLPWASNALRLTLDPSRQYIINVGSVGQPRDGRPEGCAVAFDPGTGSLEFVRLPYPWHVTQDKIRRAGLPAFLADRLAYGR